MGRSFPSSNRESISIWCFGIARSIPELVELEFTDTNTSSVLATELAQPRFVEVFTPLEMMNRVASQETPYRYMEEVQEAFL